MITLYTWPTPNGYKPMLALEEMGLAYTIETINIGENVQKEPEFLAMNPNGRIPVMKDHEAEDFVIFESGAILVYLAEKTGQFFGGNAKERSIVMQWLMWQMGGLGPMMGQANQYVTFLPEEHTHPLNRYKGESERLFGVMEMQLEKTPYLAGDYSIADMATWPWVRGHPMAGVDINAFPKVKAWFDTIAARPAVATMFEKLPGRDPVAFAKTMQEKRAANMAAGQ